MTKTRNRSKTTTLTLCLALAAGTTAFGRAGWKDDHDAGWSAYKEGRFAEAEKKLRAAAKAAREFGPDDPRLAVTLDHLAWVLCTEGKGDEGETFAKEALALREKGNKDVLDGLHTLACLYDLDGKPREAKPVYERYLKALEASVGPEHPDVAAALDNLATVHHALGDHAAAETTYKRALALREKAGEAKLAELAPTLHNLGSLHLETGKLDQAEPLLTRALAIRRKTLGADHPDVGVSLEVLGRLFTKQGKKAEALRVTRQALQILELDLGPKHPHVLRCCADLAECCRAVGHGDEAKALDDRVKAGEAAK